MTTYRHLRVGNVGGEYGYWLLEGNECYSAEGFPSNPILSGSAPNKTKGKQLGLLKFQCFARNTIMNYVKNIT
jgi:hypothetical protein